MDSPYPQNLEKYIGKHKTQLPSPSLCINLPAVKENARVFHETVKKSGVRFRAHLKTNKTVEITRILLGDSTSRVIVSTLREAWGVKSLIEEGLVNEVLFGIPIGPSVLPELDTLAKSVSTVLIIDHAEHISLLDKFARSSDTTSKPWPVFIKLDLGARRAGLPLKSPALKNLIELVETSPNVTLFGFYAYASHADCTSSVSEAEEHLKEQVSSMLAATQMVKDQNAPLILSVGSSPTARVLKPIQAMLPDNVTFEIHAGSLIFNDLQQLATATVADESCLAATVMAEICSVYPERNEALISAGVLALTREPQPGSLPGIARVRDSKRKNWIVGRVSQEHGILVYDGNETRKVEEHWKIGDVVELDIQHSCIVAAMFGWYFVTDGEGIVRDIYYPWKWW